MLDFSISVVTEIIVETPSIYNWTIIYDNRFSIVLLSTQFKRKQPILLM